MRPRLLVLAAALCFGTTGTAQALGPDAPSPTVGAARIAGGALLLVAVAIAARGRSRTPWDRRALAAAGAGVAGYQVCFFSAVADTGVAVGTVVALGSAPALAGLLARIVDATALGARWLACTALATAGVALLVAGGRSATVSPPGVLLAVGAGASYALYTVFGKRLLEAGHAPEAVMARTFSLGALLLAPVLILGEPGHLLTRDGVVMVLFLAAVPTALAYVLFARGLRHLAPGETATLTLAEPLTAAALGAIVLAERPGPLAMAGAGLVLAGLAALAVPARGRLRGAAPAPPPGAR